MRILSSILWVLAALAAGAAVLAYLYTAGMACAFVTSGQPCRTRWPWQLSGGDLYYLVVIPAAVTGGLVLAAIMAWKGRKLGTLLGLLVTLGGLLMLAPALGIQVNPFHDPYGYVDVD